MPTELFGETGHLLAEAGAEFGTVTGRPRRCGWFDASLVRFSGQLNGFTGLALTKLDVLDDLPVVKICIGYRTTGSEQVNNYWEGDTSWLGNVEPVYIEMEGWGRSTKQIRSFDNLPQQAKAYIQKVEELVGVPVEYISVGPEREAVIRL